ncbi:cytochrome c3 family protein [Oceanidesulfovibrio marinus]|uniref:Cytochrome C n=1 Tax=Oceanidesulfovibrio marinus TaxID=370038 RepID=A0A6P1ZLI2_9BACT|nr:cytochrome c3 family protein [Oceanidesulfovibrio marinus]QJT07481.1 cytochrome C [Oceanidesulfovibrio marinus]TVM34606.1 cytochrome C [Oceanidesulfovibrio marinus]
MKKSLLVCLTAAALVLAFALPSIYAEDAPADGLVLDHTDDAKGYKVTFNHTSHASVDCTTCHHQEGDKQYASCVTEGCHSATDKAADLSWYKVVHNRKAGVKETCMSCHVETAGSDKELKKKLTGCMGSACHPK